MNRRMLLITGPQGSGNHMFAKIFALHPDVLGWKSLNETYWIGHDQEPFNCLWVDPNNWSSFDFGNYQYAVASISCPYVQQGRTVLPDYQTFISQAQLHGWQVQIVVIGRDINVLSHQQERLRSRKTFPLMLDHLDQVLAQYNPDFVSHELAVLYGGLYLQSLSRSWDFPIAWQDPRVKDILKDNSNQKYFQAVKHSWVDDLAIQGLASTAQPGTEWYQRDQQIIKNKGEL
jgi:hypothetical protein